MTMNINNMNSEIERFIFLTKKESLSIEEMQEYKELESLLSCDVEDHYATVQNETDEILEKEYKIEPNSPAFYILAQIDSICDKIEKGKISATDHKKLIHYFHNVAKRVESLQWNSIEKKKIGRPSYADLVETKL